MSAIDYTKLTIDELLRKFAETAKLAGCIYSSPHKITNPMRVKYFAEMRTIGAEIKEKSSRDEVRQLFNDPDPDVRGVAGRVLYSIDPEWAWAAELGLIYHLKTQEIVAWRARILKRPSRRVALGKLTVAQLVDCFVDACERCYGATRFLTDEEGGGPSMKAHNKVAGDIYAAAKELNRRGELRALLPLLNHPLVTVRQRAAAYCLPVATESATAVLQEVYSEGESPEYSKAIQTLDYWRDGQYCAFPGDPSLIRI